MQLGFLLPAGLLTCLLTASAAAQTAVPDAPVPQAPAETRQKLPMAPQAKEANWGRPLAVVNGRLYDQPTGKDKFVDYLKDSYGLPAFGRSTLRASYAQWRGKPEAWGDDFPGYMQRFASAMGSNAITGNVRYGMETVFHEDMRYIACHGCTMKHKIENSLLAEFTARHDKDGHRFLTLTPVISDFSGPIIANTIWTPSRDPAQGVIGARTVFATRIAGHLFQEFVWERRHHDPTEKR